jgi:hypothetical protein
MRENKFYYTFVAIPLWKLVYVDISTNVIEEMKENPTWVCNVCIENQQCGGRENIVIILNDFFQNIIGFYYDPIVIIAGYLALNVDNKHRKH